MIYLTRKEHFNAAHKLRRDDWSDEKNAEVFGKCANKNWHGHNYDLYVTVKGEPSPETGFIVNAKDLSKLIREKIVDKLDHMNLDLDVPFLQGQFTSTENLVKEIWNQLEPHLKGCRLHCIKLQETDTIWCEYFGE